MIFPLSHKCWTFHIYPLNFEGDGPHYPRDEEDFLRPEERKIIERVFVDFTAVQTLQKRRQILHC
ncbi:MAG: hypothetical protein ACI808_000003 [Paraglaciecola sp.]|jgi:hypothetical protein